MKAVAVTGPIAAHAAQDVNSNDTEDRGRERIDLLETAVMLPFLRLFTVFTLSGRPQVERSRAEGGGRRSGGGGTCRSRCARELESTLASS